MATASKPRSTGKKNRKLLPPKVKSKIGRVRLRQAVRAVQRATEAA